MTVERADESHFWREWMLASALGFGVGWLLGFFLAQAVVGIDHLDPQGGPVLGPGGYLISYPVAGAFCGIAQWLVLRRYVSWSDWWLLPAAVIFGSGFGWFVSVTVGRVGIVVVVILGAMFGGITGVPLVRHLRQRSRQPRG